MAFGYPRTTFTCQEQRSLVYNWLLTSLMSISENSPDETAAIKPILFSALRRVILLSVSISLFCFAKHIFTDAKLLTRNSISATRIADRIMIFTD